MRIQGRSMSERRMFELSCEWVDWFLISLVKGTTGQNKPQCKYIAGDKTTVLHVIACQLGFQIPIKSTLHLLQLNTTARTITKTTS